MLEERSPMLDQPAAIHRSQRTAVSHLRSVVQLKETHLPKVGFSALWFTSPTRILVSRTLAKSANVEPVPEGQFQMC